MASILKKGDTMQRNHDFMPKLKVHKATDYLTLRASPTGFAHFLRKCDLPVTFAGILHSSLYVAKVA